MNLNKEHWQEKDYEEYLEYLKSLREEEYQKFHQKLTTTKYEILGLRVPLQRKIAMEISKGNIEEFLEFCQDTYYEEVNIEGFVLAKIKDLALLEKYFDSFLLKIDVLLLNQFQDKLDLQFYHFPVIVAHNDLYFLLVFFP